MAKRKNHKLTSSRLKKPLFDLGSQTKKAIWGILFFALAVIIFFSLWHKAGVFGELTSRFFKYLFGWGYLVLPFVLVLVAFEFLRSKRQHLYFATLFGAFLFFISLLGLFERFSQSSAGVIGYATASALNNFFGFWASVVLLFAFIIISVVMMLNIPLRIGKSDGDDEDDDDEEEISKAPEIERDEPREDETESKNIVAASSQKISENLLSRKTVSGESSQDLKVPRLASRTYNAPTIDLLERDGGKPLSGDIKANSNIIRRTLEHFGIEVEMGEVNVGPAITQYTLRPAQGIKLAKIVALHNDLALALATHPLRIEAPIPGKALVGVEVPNKTIALVRLGSLLESDFFQKADGPLTFAIGRDVSGSAFYGELSKMPHLLIAGATGSGKSVCIHSLITSLLWRNGPAILKLILIDPKRVELAYYKDIPHILTPVINDGKRAINALRWAVKDMERRYEQLSGEGFRDIIGFNNHAAKNGEELMPYIVIVIDELADLMAAWGREVEGTIIRLAQMARAVGIHLVVSTQRPSVEVITGLIKANITTRVAFQVASQVDSRTILDMAGAEKLLGNGDMLYLAGDSSKPKRIQGVYIAEKEIKMITDYIRKNNNSNDEKGDSPQDSLDLTSQQDRSRIAFSPIGSETLDEDGPEDDEMYDEAKRVVIEAQKASASLLQRRLRVGYARAARLLDILEQQGIIGPGDGAKPREVFLKNDEYDQGNS